jgi:hypothetical protein
VRLRAAGGAALNIVLVSPTDRCCIGINVDSAAVTDPDEITACLDDACDEIFEVGRAAPGRRNRRRTS